MGKNKQESRRTTAPRQESTPNSAAETDDSSPSKDSSTEDFEKTNGFSIVGIGASAGGLAALKKLFSHVPRDSDLAFVVVMHLSPERESHLAELLQPHLPIPVQQVTKTVRLERNHVYVIPPNANLDTIDTHLRLTELEERRQERAPIDHFFRTLAKMHDGEAIGVILTGTGSDGTLGLREIKERGGLTVVQDPNEAEYDGMPQSAIATGLVDLVLPLDQMVSAILRYARTQPKVLIPDEEEDVEGEMRRQLQKVFAQLRARTGRDFSRYKRSTVLRRIHRRMQLCYLEELADYLNLLREEPDEVRELADDLLITVTNFFRDPEVFEMLEREVVPLLFEGKAPEEDVRLWSVGCATGEEAYSLAILLLEQAGRLENPPRIQVFASDLHERSLQHARHGFYPGDIETDVSPERLKRFFSKEDGGYRIGKEVREVVVFAPHNLMSDPPFSRLDLVTCRNVLIYLQRDMQRDIVELFHYALRPEGFLILGSSETMDTTDLFRITDKRSCIYRKRNVPPPEPRLPVFPLTPTRLKGFAQGEQRTGEPVAYGALHQRMVEQYAPPSALVSSDDKLVHLSEHAGRFLVHPGGEITANIYKLVREEFRIELRSAMHTARERLAPVSTKPILVRFDREIRSVVIHVRPAAESQDGFALLIFDMRPTNESTKPLDAEEAPTRAEEAPRSNREGELGAELDLTRQRLQAIIEEFESSQEEMKASNEELQSANEELRSTMEELETSKEELQSMNEELQTVNQENRHKVEELAQLTGDLQNLMAATEIATMFLDRDLRIMRFTPPIGELFNIRTTDRGRPLADLTNRLGYRNLLEDAGAVLRKLVRIEREVRDEQGRWYLSRLLPYRSTDDRIEGVVITFIDITERKLSEEAVRTVNEQLEHRVADRTAKLERQNQQLRKLAMQLTAVEHRERHKLAMTLHDGLQQYLIAGKMQLPFCIEGGSEAVERLGGLIDQAIEVSRSLSCDLSPPTLHNSDLPESLQWISRWFHENHDFQVELETDSEFPVLPEHLKIFLFNAIRELLLNSVKHSGKKQGRVELHADGLRIRIVVRDDGDGFDPEELQPDENELNGFGLFSIRERLLALGGNLEIETSPGDGSRFVLELPLTGDEKPRVSASDVSATDGRGTRAVGGEADDGELRVLVVDDHRMFREGLCALARLFEGISLVGQAADGIEAVEKVEELRPDVVLMDVDMPRMNGIDATREIKTRYPSVVVIGLTFHEEPETDEALRRSGASASVRKGVDAETLFASIRELYFQPDA